MAARKKTTKRKTTKRKTTKRKTTKRKTTAVQRAAIAEARKRKTAAKRKAPAPGELGAPRKPLKKRQRPERRLLGVAPGKKTHNVLSDEAKARQKKRLAEMRKNPPGQAMLDHAMEIRKSGARRKVAAGLTLVCNAIDKLPEGDGPYAEHIAGLHAVGAELRELCAED